MRVIIAGEERSVLNPSADWLQKNVSIISDGFGFYISDRNGVRTVTDRRVVLVTGRQMSSEQARWLNASRHTEASGKVQLPNV